MAHSFNTSYPMDKAGHSFHQPSQTQEHMKHPGRIHYSLPWVEFNRVMWETTVFMQRKSSLSSLQSAPEQIGRDRGEENKA